MSSAILKAPPRRIRMAAHAATLGALLGVSLLGGCAVGPARVPGGPPVEDRSVPAGTQRSTTPAAVRAVPAKAPGRQGGAVAAPAEVLQTPQARPLEELVETPGTAPPPDSVAAPDTMVSAPTAPSSSKSGAVVALLDNAGAQSQRGRLESAAASLERALRIEPDNADVWYRLAVIRLLQGQDGQAEQLAMKSNALAGADASLRGRNWSLIAEARRRRGDTAGAQAAEAEARRHGH